MDKNDLLTKQDLKIKEKVTSIYDGIDEIVACPNCFKPVEEDNQEKCKHCGVLLDWSEEYET